MIRKQDELLLINSTVIRWQNYHVLNRQFLFAPENEKIFLLSEKKKKRESIKEFIQRGTYYVRLPKIVSLCHLQ